METNKLDKLEETLQTLGDKANLSFSKKQAIRDKVFQSIGQVELADAIIQGEQKATIAVSLQYLKKALIPHKLTFSIPVTLAVMIFIFAFSVMTGALAQNSNPTDTLFPIKRILEKIELAFISNPVSKAEFRLDIAGERLKYLETSINQEDSLSKVLTESQIALVDARTALKKIQAIESDDGDDQGVTELVERFSVLLGDQRTLLDNIEQNIEDTDEDVRNAVLAIRETLEKNEEEIDAIVPKADTNTSPSVIVLVPQTKVDTSEPIVNQPFEDGLHTFKTRIVTTNGKLAVIVDGMHYVIVSAPINLFPYVGFSVYVTGDISGKEIKIYEIASDSVILK